MDVLLKQNANSLKHGKIFLISFLKRMQSQAIDYIFFTSEIGTIFKIVIAICVSNGCMLHAESLKLCPTLCTPMDCSPAGISVHGIL